MEMVRKQKLQNWEDFDRGVFAVNTIGIVFDTKSRKILVGKVENDSYVSKLSWKLPGGRPDCGEDLEKALEGLIKSKTGLKVKSLGTIFARNAPREDRILLIYYLCEVVSGRVKPGDEFIELEWIDPKDIEDYLSTSLDPRLKEYIMNIR